MPKFKVKIDSSLFFQHVALASAILLEIAFRLMPVADLFGAAWSMKLNQLSDIIQTKI